MTNDYNDFRVRASADSATGSVSVARGKGAVVSPHRQSSELAIEILRDGGNAFDAAFAIAFDLSIAHPQAGNIGGGGYLLFTEKGGHPKAYNYRETAPRYALREAFLLPDGSPNPDKTAFGPASVCVPGTVKAFFTLHARRGKLKAKDLLSTISKRAEKGASITQYEADCLNRLAPKLEVSPESKKIYVKSTPFKAGDILRNPNLARTFDTLAREGETAFYRGKIAEQIVADLSANGSFVTTEDLAAYAIREVTPISIEIRGKQVWTAPPESGGAILLEILHVLDRPEFYRLAWGSLEYYHYLSQASKIAFIDRADYMGDTPLDNNAVYRGIFSRANVDRLFGLIDPTGNTPTDALARKMREGRAAPDNSATTSGKNTTFFAVIDAEGNAVANSYTLNLRYGSKWSVANAGFLLNGSMDSFSFVEGKENYFGVVGSAPNLFAPGKRPASNMAPVLVTEGGRVDLLLGTPGGPTIPTSLANIFEAIAVHGIAPEKAILSKRLHHQGWPDTLYHEAGFDRPDLLSAMSAMRYAVKDKHELIADIHAIVSEREGYLAVSDYRREGRALAHP